MRLTEIKALDRLAIVGEDREITGVNTHDNTNINGICYWNGITNPLFMDKLKGTCIAPYGKFIFVNESITWILSENPKLTMAKVILECFMKEEKIDNGLTNKYESVIFKGVIINQSAIIYPQSTIGKSGFGYIWDSHWLRFPHIGGVVIEKDVEIGSNVCIDRGSIGNTIIREGVKIDNLVHVAHNAEIGKYTLIVAGSVIGGSVKIGEKCFIGMNVSIKNHLTIGDNVTIGAGAVVICDIPSGTWAGVPAKKIK